MNHLRPHNHYAPDLRRWKPGLYIDTGFDRTAHKVDVRRIAARARPLQHPEHRHLPLVAERLQPHRARRRPPRPTREPSQLLSASARSASTCRCFTKPSPRATRSPRRHSPSTSPTACAAACCATTFKGRRRELLRRRQAASRCISTASRSIPYEIQVCRSVGRRRQLDQPAGRGSPYAAAVDPELGRIALPPPRRTPAPPLQVSYHYGFNADMGGGEYPRERHASWSHDPAWIVPVSRHRRRAALHDLQAALNFAVGAAVARTGSVAVEITDSDTLTAHDVRSSASICPPERRSSSAPPTARVRRCCSTTRSRSPATPPAPSSLNGCVDRRRRRHDAGSSDAGRARPSARATPADGNQASQPAQPHPLHAGSRLVGRDRWHAALPDQPAWSPNLPAASRRLKRSILGAIRACRARDRQRCDSIVDATDPHGRRLRRARRHQRRRRRLTLRAARSSARSTRRCLRWSSDSIFWAGLAATERHPGSPRWSPTASRRAACASASCRTSAVDAAPVRVRRAGAWPRRNRSSSRCATAIRAI